MKCPASSCRSGTPERQRDLTPGEFETIPEPDRAKVKDAGGQPRRCTYCGCVYSFGQPPRIFGFLDDGVSGRPWLPRAAY